MVREKFSKDEYEAIKIGGIKYTKQWIWYLKIKMTLNAEITNLKMNWTSDIGKGAITVGRHLDSAVVHGGMGQMKKDAGGGRV